MPAQTPKNSEVLVNVKNMIEASRATVAKVGKMKPEETRLTFHTLGPLSTLVDKLASEIDRAQLPNNSLADECAKPYSLVVNSLKNKTDNFTNLSSNDL